MYSGASCSGVIYLLPLGMTPLARPSATEVLSVESVLPVTPVVSSSIAPLPVGVVSSMVGMVAWVVGAVEGWVLGMVGMVVGSDVGVLASFLPVLVHPQPVNMAAVRTRVSAIVRIFFIL